ncbi:MAG TPA: hypothetical protein VGS08_00120 [Candidatus Saccharimonadales bacterium]|nr:hypothetical protein [Candidatus Saccharimonadales bacterium]
MTHQQNHIIYVPGIHDDIYHAQGLLVKAWRLFGVRGHCQVMPWFGEQSYETKIQHLQGKIDYYKAQGHKVFLIGASAGASAVLNLYADNSGSIEGVALICPKINRPETVRRATYKANPAFRTSLSILQPNLAKLTSRDKAHIIIYYSPKDGVIPHRDSRIPGVKEYKLPAVGHGYAILYAITLGSPKLCDRLKKLATT